MKDDTLRGNRAKKCEHVDGGCGLGCLELFFGWEIEAQRVNSKARRKFKKPDREA